MNSFSSILFPIDFSPASHASAQFVKAIARRFQAEVYALHVVEVPPAWYSAPQAATFDPLIDISSVVEDRRAALRSFVSDELSGTPVQQCVQTSSDPAAIIARFSQQNLAGLIAMPTHGYGPLRSLLLGSVTAKVLHDAECPVWTLAHAGEAAFDPVTNWRRILCAVGGNSADVPLIRWAAQLACEQGAELELVHAVTGLEGVPSHLANDPWEEFLFNVAGEQITKLQTEAGTGFPLCIEAGSASQVVRNVAIEHSADLVIVGRGAIQRPLGRLRSNAYAIVRDAPCPVISVPGQVSKETAV